MGSGELKTSRQFFPENSKFKFGADEMKLKLLLIVACTHAAALAPGAVKPSPALGAPARRALSPSLSVAKELDTAALGTLCPLCGADWACAERCRRWNPCRAAW